MAVRIFSLFILAVALTVIANAQQPNEVEATRGIWPPSYRPAAPSATKPKPRPNTYKRVSPPTNSPIEANAESTVGLTLWRLRPEEAADAKQPNLGRLLVKVNGKIQSFIPERVEASTSFAVGQMVRISVEVPRTGYLYVIDREQFTDGTLGDATLIFPQAPNEHRVTAGQVIEIPNQQAESFAFEFTPPKSGGRPLAGEMLTFLVTPKPLPELASFIGTENHIDAALLAKWEREYGAKAEQLELKNGAGTAYTAAEKQAGLTRSTALKQDDPLPQTVFRVAAKAGNPLLIRLPLRVGK